MEPGIERHIGGWFSVGGKVKIPGDRFVIITHREGDDDEDTTTAFTSNITQYYKAPALAAQIHDKLPIFSSVKLFQNSYDDATSIRLANNQHGLESNGEGGVRMSTWEEEGVVIIDGVR